MGTWEDGLLDNDTALDGLGDLQSAIVADIVELGAAKPTATSTGRLAGAVGALLQLSAYDFDDEADGSAIAAAVKAHAAEIAKLPAPARKLLDQVAAGHGKALAEREAKLPVEQMRLLHSGGKGASPFGRREPSLFATKAAAAYVQEIAQRCVGAVDGDFEDENNWNDLCREGVGIGTLPVLLVLAPCRVPTAKIERWRKKAKKGIASLEEEPDEELDFHRGYYAKLDKVLALLLRRFRQTR